MVTQARPQQRFGSPLGLALTVGLGFAFYFALHGIGGSLEGYSYAFITKGITESWLQQGLWFLMNFTEAQFYAGALAGVGIILGGCVAWLLARSGSRLAGLPICYGASSLFPWVLAAQVLSLSLSIFVFGYIKVFAQPDTAWVATFICVVGAPPALMLMYGPSVPALIIGSVLGGLICAPTAIWLGATLTPMLQMPPVIANVLAMAITGIIICMVCQALRLQKKPVKAYPPAPPPNVYSATWSLRRSLADFSEAQFYACETASLFLLAGLVLDWLISSSHGAYGSKVLPAILLAQFVGSGVGVFLYAAKYDQNGWCATFIPVVSVGPACVLVLGASIPVAVLSGILGGILSAPTAEYFAGKLPQGIAPTVANVSAMAVCTCIILMTLRLLGCA